MRVIRHGISRTVILIGRWAIKVPSARGHTPGGPRGRLAGICHGVLANQSETVWSAFDDWQGRVAPVKHSWLLGLVNVYPRCESVDENADRDELRDELAMDPDPGDHKPDNYGLLNGQLVRVDYSM